MITENTTIASLEAWLKSEGVTALRVTVGHDGDETMIRVEVMRGMRSVIRHHSNLATAIDRAVFRLRQDGGT